jgi:hypothetical protein
MTELRTRALCLGQVGIKGSATLKREESLPQRSRGHKEKGRIDGTKRRGKEGKKEKEKEKEKTSGSDT